jgi:hypothetical protein
MKALITTAVAVLVLGAGAIYFAHETQQPAPTPVVGSAGPIDNVNYHCWAGACDYYAATSLRTATQTPCAIQSPAGTSTLAYFNVRLDVSSSTATTWDMAKATTAFATTTTLGTAALAVPANGQALLVATATAPTAILAPNTWIVLGARAGITGGDTAGTGFVPSGQCSAKFITTQN